MRATHAILILATVLLTLWVRDAVPGEDEQPEIQPPTPEQMARMVAAAAPGPEHAVLARLAGTWDAGVKIWMDPTVKEPLVMTAKVENAMLLGGRFLSTRTAGPSPFGDFESLSILGCDRRDGTWTSVGFDTMGTYSVSARGRLDEARQAIDLRGEDEDPIQGHAQTYRFVTTIVSDDEYVVEWFFSDRMHTRGLVDAHRLIEIRHRRVKPAAPAPK